MPSLGPSLKIGRDIFDSGPPPFDGGLFANGGFEDGFANWANYGPGDSWIASAGADTVENPSLVPGKFLYQNKTLISGATYEISAVRISGDAVVTFCVDDVDTYNSIDDGPYRFIGAGVQMSYGLTLSEVGTGTTVCDDLRLIQVFPDQTPDGLEGTFQPDVDVAVDTMITCGESYTVAGVEYDCPISVLVGNYQINGGGWVNTAGVVSNGDVVQIQLESSPNYSEVYSAILTIGTAIDTFTVTTLDLPANAVTYNGEPVTVDGELLTHTP